MELFQLLAQFLQGITAWLPRPYLVNVTQRAVLFRRGQGAILKAPGLHWHTPLFSDYALYSVLKDATEFSPVVLLTKDGKTVSIGFVIVWSLKPGDIIKAATTTGDLLAMVGEIGESLLPPLVLSLTLEELQDRVRGVRNMKTVNQSLREDAQVLLADYGITVDSARINTLAPCRVFKLINS